MASTRLRDLMEPLANELWKSCIRSRLRRRALVLFSSMGEMYLGQAARMIGVQPSRVRALLYGDGKGFSRELGLVTLGLVREKPTYRGRAWEITSRGRRKARSIAAAEGRSASAAAWRAIAEGAAREQDRGPRGTASDNRCEFTWTVGSGTGGTSPG